MQAAQTQYAPYITVEKLGRYRIVNISDLHIPYQSEDGIKTVLQYADENTGLVINGDVLDCTNASKFPAYAVDDLLGSYITAVQILGQFKDAFEEVFVVAGNHDLRYERMLRRNRLFAELAEIFGGCDLLAKICAEAGVTYSRNGFRINDVIFFHPDNYLSTTLGTSRKVVEYMLQFEPDYKAVSIGHTHQLGYGRHFGKLMFESGKMCELTPHEQVSHNVNLKYSPIGFIVFTFTDCKLTSYEFVEVGGGYEA